MPCANKNKAGPCFVFNPPYAFSLWFAVITDMFSFLYSILFCAVCLFSKMCFFLAFLWTDLNPLTPSLPHPSYIFPIVVRTIYFISILLVVTLKIYQVFLSQNLKCGWYLYPSPKYASTLELALISPLLAYPPGDLC